MSSGCCQFYCDFVLEIWFNVLPVPISFLSTAEAQSVGSDLTSDAPMPCSEYSKQLNDSRIMILQAREDALQGIVKDVQSKLSQYSSNKKKYTSLLTDLILQVCPSTTLTEGRHPCWKRRGLSVFEL